MATAVSWETEAAETLQERVARLKESISRSAKQTHTPALRSDGKKPHTPHSAWPPGTSGNPNGRPKNAQCLTSIARDMLDKPADLPDDAPESIKGCTWGELIAYRWLLSSAKPIPPMFNSLIDHIEGKVITPIEATGKDGMPIEVALHARGKIADAIDRLVARAGEN